MQVQDKKFILVVDDGVVDAMLRGDFARNALEKRGKLNDYEVIEAGDKKAADAMIAKHGKSITAIILDNDFPDPATGGHLDSGLKLLSELRRKRNNTPVLWNTAVWGKDSLEIAGKLSQVQEAAKSPERRLAAADKPDFVQIDSKTFALNKGSEDAQKHIIEFVGNMVDRAEKRSAGR